jgi:hypothetical protein
MQRSAEKPKELYMGEKTKATAKKTAAPKKKAAVKKSAKTVAVPAAPIKKSFWSRLFGK